MNDDFDLSMSELRKKHRKSEDHSGNGNGSWTRNGHNGYANGHYNNGNGNGNGTHTRTWSRVVDTGSPVHEEREVIQNRAKSKGIDVWRLLDALVKKWPLIVFSSIVLAGAAFVCGLFFAEYSVQVPLIRQETYNSLNAGGNDSIPVRELSPQTLFELMRSPDVLRRVSERANPPIAPQDLFKSVKIIPDRSNPDFVNVELSSKNDTRALVGLANLYADVVVQYTKELQVKESTAINEYLTRRLDLVNEELAGVNQKLAQFSRDANVLDFEKEIESHLAQTFIVDNQSQSTRIDRDTLDLRIQALKRELLKQNPINDMLQAAKNELNMLLLNKREAHPDVIAQVAKIATLERQSSQMGTNTTSTASSGSSLANALQLQIVEMESSRESMNRRLAELDSWRTNITATAKRLAAKTGDYAALKAQRQNLEITRSQYASRQREARLMQNNALGYFRVFSKATEDDVSSRKRWMILTALAAAGAALGFLGMAGMIVLAEALDTRIKTAADLARVSQLPVLATLGDLRKMSPTEQVNWAFRTLTMLQGRLRAGTNQGLVCGFISSQHGEGRSTWVNLLVSAASQRGLKVLTVATRPSTSPDDLPQVEGKNASLLPVGPTTMLNNNVLAAPDQVTEQFSDPEAQPVVHIPLPGWVWNLERRKQWQSAVTEWQKIENLVLLIELPPACEPEAVLLAENLPQVIWLASSGTAKEEETRMQLETLRHARCRLVGAVLNREQPSFWRRHFSSWMRTAGALLLMMASVHAAEVNQPEISEGGLGTNQFAFTQVSATNRAPWLQKLTLGPGDILDFGLHRHPELFRTNIVINADGRVSYLQAQNIMAAGLTVDELRARMNQELERFYPSPYTIVTPVSYNSKKYFVLGRVVNRGVFTLDRPITVLEAVARAKGLETGFVERNTVEVADLTRSFLVRGGKRLPVNLERLFQQGDFSQNIFLEPNDYLYFASAGFQEIYVLGEVTAPGPAPFASGASVVSVLSARGGFTPRAYRKKVLVIRGSLQTPETFVVDTAAVLSGTIPDVKLQPKDIVYVNARPWIKVEELLDAAGEAFVQAAITTWAGANVSPVIKNSFLPDL